MYCPLRRCIRHFLATILTWHKHHINKFLKKILALQGQIKEICKFKMEKLYKLSISFNY